MQGDLKQRLTELADRTLSGMSMELVDLELEFSGRRRILRFFLDRVEGGITVDDCADASRALDQEIEAGELVSGAWVLEVSSPGIERRVARPRDFVRFTGRQVRLRTAAAVDGRRRFTGVIKAADGEGLTLAVAEGGELRLAYGQVARANLIDVELGGNGDGTGSA
ncbi:MAG: ribosome maturation factor RimP [Deltaproteobacteria bacterium]|nr:ribosome maturation factor RimP [Deltaproteobacteria bacterium]